MASQEMPNTRSSILYSVSLNSVKWPWEKLLSCFRSSSIHLCVDSIHFRALCATQLGCVLFWVVGLIFKGVAVVLADDFK